MRIFCGILIVLLICGLAFAAPSIVGKWKANVVLPNGDPVSADIEFKEEGGKLTGVVMVPEAGRLVMEDLKLEGDDLSFKVSNDGVLYTVKVTVNGDTMKGGFKTASGGSGTITASR